MGAKGVGQTRAHGLMVRCRREAWSDKRSLHNAPCELEILLECDRMVFLWIRRTPDRHILWEVKALRLSDMITQTGVKSDCVTQIRGILNE